MSCPNAVVEGTQSGSVGENMRWEDGDLGIMVGVGVEVGPSQEGVGTVSLSGDMYKGVIVISESRDKAGYTSHDVLGVGIVFKVLMVSVDRDGV